MSTITAFISGVIFAIGLAISGMTQPQKIIAFLNFAGDWDPSLMFVMIGAIAVHAVAYRWIRRRNKPLYDSKFNDPEETRMTRSLVLGSLTFGVGWGLGGYCPGPAIASLATFAIRPAVFVAAMLIGMFLFRKLSARLK
jgi:uncharacterized protein